MCGRGRLNAFIITERQATTKRCFLHKSHACVVGVGLSEGLHYRRVTSDKKAIDVSCLHTVINHLHAWSGSSEGLHYRRATRNRCFLHKSRTPGSCPTHASTGSCTHPWSEAGGDEVWSVPTHIHAHRTKHVYNLSRSLPQTVGLVGLAITCITVKYLLLGHV